MTDQGSPVCTGTMERTFQTSLFVDEASVETPGFLSDQLVTYIGNKRALIPDIEVVVESVLRRLQKRRIRILDAFSGSGVVARYLKRHAEYLATIDIEDYAAVLSRCFLRNRSTVNVRALKNIVTDLNSRVHTVALPTGFIELLYAPREQDRISKEDRVFYTKQNARKLDNYRRMIGQAPSEYQEMILGPLLSEASVHANTSGVFKGFYKDRRTGVGQFGGTNGDALKRIMTDIVLDPPVLSRFECEVDVLQGDANNLAPRIRDLDLAYLDPPYNQHPYGSNYFMLNLIVNYERPTRISKMSGIPADWRRSQYNVRDRAKISFQKLVNSLQAKFILISFNSEGFISRADMISTLRSLGTVEVFDIRYNTFRGCRNLRNRATHVTEQMFLVERD